MRTEGPVSPRNQVVAAALREIGHRVSAVDGQVYITAAVTPHELWRAETLGDAAVGKPAKSFAEWVADLLDDEDALKVALRRAFLRSHGIEVAS